MSYTINTIDGTTSNAWVYWVNNPPNGNILSLGATLNFDHDYGKIIINAGTIFDGNGYSFNFTNIKSTGMQLFDLQGGITSNLSIGTSLGTKGILLINTLNNNSSTIMNGNISIVGNLSVSEQLQGNAITANTLSANTLSANTLSGNIVSNLITLSGNDLQKILNNKIDNSTKNIMFKIIG